MKTLGVLGGLGPQATIDFEARVHRVAQRLIPPSGNTGYPPMVVYYHRRPPLVMQDAHTPRFPLEPDPDLLEAAHWLGTKAAFLVIPANGPHMFHDQIERAAGCPVLSIIDVTLDAVQQRGWRTIGVLGFGDPAFPVYTQRLRQLDLAYETIEVERQAKLNQAIVHVHEGRDTDESRAIARDAVAALRARPVDGIILGCTELPLLLPEEADTSDLVNPAQLLAEAAVQYALT
jgi:aspartate racemase